MKFTFTFSGKRYGASLTTTPYDVSTLEEAIRKALRNHNMFDREDIEFMTVEGAADHDRTYYRNSNGRFIRSDGKEYPFGT